MAFLRIMLVSVLAAVAGCAIVSLILFGRIDRASFIPMIFALPSSIFLLATGYAALAERGQPTGFRYVALIVMGALGGGLILGLLSDGNGQNAIIGSFYGLATSTCWIALHALTRQIGRALINQFKS